ncbi:uncharacterized protein LOC144456601 isoform X1 [Phascolarctos cinereus]
MLPSTDDSSDLVKKQWVQDSGKQLQIWKQDGVAAGKDCTKAPRGGDTENRSNQFVKNRAGPPGGAVAQPRQGAHARSQPGAACCGGMGSEVRNLGGGGALAWAQLPPHPQWRLGRLPLSPTPAALPSRKGHRRAAVVILSGAGSLEAGAFPSPDHCTASWASPIRLTLLQAWP